MLEGLHFNGEKGQRDGDHYLERADETDAPAADGEQSNVSRP